MTTWTPVCVTEELQLADAQSDFQAADAIAESHRDDTGHKTKIFDVPD